MEWITHTKNELVNQDEGVDTTAAPITKNYHFRFWPVE